MYTPSSLSGPTRTQSTRVMLSARKFDVKEARCYIQFLKKKNWRTSVLFVWPLIPLFWTSDDVCRGFERQSGSSHLCASLPVSKGILRFTCGATPADFFAASMADVTYNLKVVSSFPKNSKILISLLLSFRKKLREENTLGPAYNKFGNKTYGICE